MRAIDEYQTVAVSAEKDAPQITLAGPHPLTLPGRALLAQFALSGGDTLFVLDEDCPYEEMLHFVLVREGVIRDHLAYGAPYTPGIFKQTAAATDQLSFTFASNEVLSLTIDPRGFRGGWGNAPGAHYPGRLLARHHLRLKRSA